MSLAFNQLNLQPHLVQNLVDIGYQNPTPIQAQAIPILLSGKDLIAQARTGTGKTAAFVLPMLHHIRSDIKSVQALVLVPTRELAIQVAQSVKKYGGVEINRQVCLLYGGQSIHAQIKLLSTNPAIVIGTPGRIIDHINRGYLHLKNIQQLVLDEADEMLKMGFLPDVSFILSQTNKSRQTALFSATLPTDIKTLASSYLKSDHEVIEIAGVRRTSVNVEQYYILVQARTKINLLSTLIESEVTGSVLIFTRTRKDSTYLVDKLQAKGHQADALNGDMTQNLREAVIHKLRLGRIRVLIATDVAARGLDVSHISLVINYELVPDTETYIHRIGRTGRANQQGKAISLITYREWRSFQNLQKKLQNQIQHFTPPTPQDIQQIRMQRLQDSIQNSLSHMQTQEEASSDNPYEYVLRQMIDQGHDLKEITLASLKLLTCTKITDLQKLPRDIPCLSPPKPREYNRSKHDIILLQSGKDCGIRPKDIVGAISNEAKIDGKQIGAIKIESCQTLIEIPKHLTQQVLEKLQGKTICGRIAELKIHTRASHHKSQSPSHQHHQLQDSPVKSNAVLLSKTIDLSVLPKQA